MPSDFCLMHVGYWVTDLAAISCLGAGLAAIVLTLLPGKRLTGKAEASDPSAFIDPGAGETARYRLAYKDLVTVKNSGQGSTQVSGLQGPQPAAEDAYGFASTRAQSAGDLALTMFDQGILGLGLGERSQEATKQIGKTRIESTSKPDSKTKVDSKSKADSKTKIEPKKKDDPKKKAADSKAKVEPKKPETKKGDAKPKVETSMAVRKITYGHKRADLLSTNPNSDEQNEDVPAPLKPNFFADVETPATNAPNYFADEKAPGFPTPSVVPQGFPAPSNEPAGFPAPSNEADAVAATFYEVAGAEAVEHDQTPAPPVEIDPKKDPKKVGRSTLIEPKSNLQSDKGPPPLEYFE